MPPKLKVVCICLLLAVGFTARADEKLIELVKNVRPAVVLITTFDANGQPTTNASGFFINDKNRIITNHHVIEGAYSATVKTSSGREYPVEGIVAKDIESDIVKLSVNILDNNITPLKLGATIPSQGEDIIVIGNPLGLETSVSTGIISAVRDIPAFGKILQMTAPVSPGSSGSPVLNTKGEVIGVATFIVIEGQNINFAVSAEKILALKETQKPPSLKEYSAGTADANDAESLYIAGVQQLWQENWAAALVYFQKAIAKNPQYAEAHYNLGVAYGILGRYEEEIGAYKQAIRIKPDYNKAQYNLGVVYGSLGRYQEAIEAFKQAIRIKPDDSKAHNNLGTAYSRLGRHEEAIEAIKQAIRINPDYAEAHCNLGVAYANLGHWEEAIEVYKQAIRIKPDDAEAHYNLGVAYGELGRHEEAMEAFKQAIRINPDYAEAHYNLGVTYGKLGRYEEEIKAYKQAIKIKPDDVEAHCNLGVSYGKLGHYEEAIEAFKQAIRIKPDLAEAHCNLGLSYLLIGDKGSALDEYKILKTLDNELANKLFNMIYE